MNRHVPPPRRNWSLIDKILMAISATDEATLSRCPQHDWSNMRAIATLYLLNWLFEVGLLSLFLRKLFAAPGEVRLDLIAASFFVATFLMAVESYMVLRSGHHLAGVADLKRGGLDISVVSPLARKRRCSSRSASHTRAPSRC